MRITPAEADNILRSGRYPTPEELDRFPFGELLRKLWERTGGDNDDYREHGPKVLKMMNVLLSNEPKDILTEMEADTDEDLLTEVKADVAGAFGFSGGHFNTNIRALFRIAALYHDIGKYIIKERHPTIGWYILEYDNSQEKNDLRTLLGNREDYFRLLMIMLRDHDEFGTLATGEASYPVLLRAATSLGKQPDIQKQILSALMWLNLADIAGTTNFKIISADVRKVYDDWTWMSQAIDHCARNSLRLDDYVIREASQEDKVVERISRLLQEASRGIGYRHEEFRVKNTSEKVRTMVHDGLKTVYPTDIPRREFAWHFTHLCKLDYGKRFFSKLVEYYEGPPSVSGEKRSLNSWSEKRVSNEDLIYSTIAILRRLALTYAAMTCSGVGHPGSLIGVEMKDLTPQNANEKTAQIIELLHRSHYPGLAWIMSDCLAWYF